MQKSAGHSTAGPHRISSPRSLHRALHSCDTSHYLALLYLAAQIEYQMPAEPTSSIQWFSAATALTTNAGGVHGRETACTTTTVATPSTEQPLMVLDIDDGEEVGDGSGNGGGGGQWWRPPLRQCGPGTGPQGILRVVDVAAEVRAPFGVADATGQSRGLTDEDLAATMRGLWILNGVRYNYLLGCWVRLGAPWTVETSTSIQEVFQGLNCLDGNQSTAWRCTVNCGTSGEYPRGGAR